MVDNNLELLFIESRSATPRFVSLVAPGEETTNPLLRFLEYVLFEVLLQGRRNAGRVFADWRKSFVLFAREGHSTRLSESPEISMICENKVQPKPADGYTSETQKEEKKLVGRKRMYLNNAVSVPDLSLSHEAHTTAKGNAKQYKDPVRSTGAIKTSGM